MALRILVYLSENVATIKNVSNPWKRTTGTKEKKNTHTPFLKSIAPSLISESKIAIYWDQYIVQKFTSK